MRCRTQGINLSLKHDSSDNTRKPWWHHVYHHYSISTTSPRGLGQCGVWCAEGTSILLHDTLPESKACPVCSSNKCWMMSIVVTAHFVFQIGGSSYKWSTFPKLRSGRGHEGMQRIKKVIHQKLEVCVCVCALMSTIGPTQKNMVNPALLGRRLVCLRLMAVK